MSVAVGWALASLFFAGLIDVTYKRYARKPRSRGFYLLGMGLTWGVLQGALHVAQGAPLGMDGVSLGYGLAAGAAVTLSNLLLIESLGHMDVSLGSTIYRLNTIGVVLASFLLLGEELGPARLGGIALGVAAVIVLYRPTSGQPAAVVPAILVLALAASACRAGYGVISKAGLTAGASASALMLLSAGTWIAGGWCYGRWRERAGRPDARQVGYAIVSGVIVFLVVNTLILGLRHGDATVVIPIANLGFLVALAVSVAWGMERFTARKGVAMALAGFAIVLLARAA